MGIMEKLSDMRRQSLDEDWRDDARAANSAKGVEDFHKKRLEKLSFSIDTSVGDFKVNIMPNWKGGLEVRVYLGDDYLFYKIFDDVESLKNYIEDGLTDKIYEAVREKFYNKVQKMPRDEAKSVLKRFDGLLDELDRGIKLEIDFDKLAKDLHRYNVYSRALNDRDSNKSALETRARRNFEKEHEFEVGDVVYGTQSSNLRGGKAYVIDEIVKKDPNLDKKYWLYKVSPENGRGKSVTIFGRHLYLDSDAINAAINNPDDPKYTPKFDQQKYMMDRYSADRQFDEAVELLNSCGMIVEAK